MFASLLRTPRTSPPTRLRKHLMPAPVLIAYHPFSRPFVPARIHKVAMMRTSPTFNSRKPGCFVIDELLSAFRNVATRTRRETRVSTSSGSARVATRLFLGSLYVGYHPTPNGIAIRRSHRKKGAPSYPAVTNADGTGAEQLFSTSACVAEVQHDQSLPRIVTRQDDVFLCLLLETP